MSTSTIQNTVNLLQMLHRSIEGVKTCPEKYIASINSVQLPLVTVWPGRGTSTMTTARASIITTVREYSVRCYMEPFGQGNYDEAPRDGQELLDKFINHYFRNNVLDDGYVIIESVDDSGIVAGTNAVIGRSSLSYAGNFYKGFTCDLTIKEIRKT